MQSPTRGVGKNALLGLGLGLFVATGFTAWVTFIRLSRGTAPFAANHTTYGQSVLFYYAGLSVGGTLAGSLWPLLRRWAVGWMIMGFVLMCPAYALFLVDDWDALARNPGWMVGGTIVGAAVVGGGVGLQEWSEGRPGYRPRGTNWRFVAAGAGVAAVLFGLMLLLYW